MDVSLHGQLRAEIQQHYQELNQIRCPWDGSEASALTKMLKANPSWTAEDWLRMIRNYFDSEGTNGKRPRVWLPQISTWARGPLDKYGRVREPETMPTSKIGTLEYWPKTSTAECYGCGELYSKDGGNGHGFCSDSCEQERTKRIAMAKAATR